MDKKSKKHELKKSKKSKKAKKKSKRKHSSSSGSESDDRSKVAKPKGADLIELEKNLRERALKSLREKDKP
jgi:hypothetical protein